MKPTLKEIGESLIKLSEQGKEIENIEIEYIPPIVFRNNKTFEESIMQGSEKQVIKLTIKQL